eukprot:CAMPEP_0119518302 /NCGR_PEP_ID=MMETSP1344-20130328/34954_1 /TAXON_ID=236787 /ORGANISM="Florenciella parvula, Strain CCMP2471" /LENGTH=47 /DNA_ID= /DNA_START= /DNA_END= /DNA_ORIENTATION=
MATQARMDLKSPRFGLLNLEGLDLALKRRLGPSLAVVAREEAGVEVL